MRRIFITVFVTGVISVCSCTHETRSLGGNGIDSGAAALAQDRSARGELDGVMRKAAEGGIDDLGWLVGRWNVVERQAQHLDEWSVRRDLSRLEYINVFYPFAPGWPINMTLDVVPTRAITAEFIERRPDGLLALVDCMGSDGLVFVGRDAMGVGYPPARGIGVTYRHWYDEQAMAEMLSLEADGLSLRCQKVSFYPRQDVVGVHAPDADWRVARSAHEYEQLKRRLMTEAMRSNIDRCKSAVGNRVKR